MEKTYIAGLRVYYDLEERAAADLVSQACERSEKLLSRLWGLKPPPDCRVYIMTSGLGFMFQSAPWPWRILLAVTLPVWALRLRRLWPLVGGWEQDFGRRRAVGIKPPRLLQTADTSLGKLVFVEDPDLSRKMQIVTSHELTHAFTAHLRLPTWLKEGLAMLAMDRFLGKPNVRPETLEVLSRFAGQHSPGGRQRLNLQDREGLVYQYVRGYWLTRYLDETHPGLLKDLLSRRYTIKELEAAVAAACGKTPDEFWREANRLVVAHFTS